MAAELQAMAWHQINNKLLSEPTMAQVWWYHIASLGKNELILEGKNLFAFAVAINET